MAVQSGFIVRVMLKVNFLRMGLPEADVEVWIEWVNVCVDVGRGRVGGAVTERTFESRRGGRSVLIRSVMVLVSAWITDSHVLVRVQCWWVVVVEWKRESDVVTEAGGVDGSDMSGSGGVGAESGGE